MPCRGSLGWLKAEFEALASKARLGGDAVEENRAQVEYLTQVLALNSQALDELKEGTMRPLQLKGRMQKRRKT